MLQQGEDVKLQHKNLVEWYRPKIVWQFHEDFTYLPYISYIGDESKFYRKKCDYFLEAKDYKLKVLEWETKLFPATWEECE